MRGARRIFVGRERRFPPQYLITFGQNAMGGAHKLAFCIMNNIDGWRSQTCCVRETYFGNMKIAPVRLLYLRIQYCASFNIKAFSKFTTYRYFTNEKEPIS
jgi:hypothetical protein